MEAGVCKRPRRRSRTERVTVASRGRRLVQRTSTPMSIRLLAIVSSLAVLFGSGGLTNAQEVPDRASATPATGPDDPKARGTRYVGQTPNAADYRARWAVI